MYPQMHQPMPLLNIFHLEVTEFRSPQRMMRQRRENRPVSFPF
jgi:hypothetical protein